MRFDWDDLTPNARKALLLMAQGQSLYRMPTTRRTWLAARLVDPDVTEVEETTDITYWLLMQLVLITFTAQTISVDRYDLSERGREVAAELEHALTEGA